MNNYYSYDHEGRNPLFMGNIVNYNREFIEIAIKETGKGRIQNEAFYSNGTPLPGYFAVYALKNEDHTDFWRAYEKAKEAGHANQAGTN